MANAWLLEREHELGLVAGWLADAAHGRGRVALVLGGAGLGKSALLGHAAVLAENAGLRVLQARAGEIEREIPFGVAQAMFEVWSRGLSDDERTQIFTGPAAHTRALLGLTGEGIGGGDPLAVIHGLYWLAANLSERRPLLLLIDDLQWADAETARWLVYLCARIHSLPLVVITAARSGEVAGEELVSAIAGSPGLTVVSLAPLGPGAVAELVRTQLHPAAGERFIEACHAASGGNPFFVRELLRAAAADGLEPTDAMADQVPELGTQEAARAILVRLARLGEPAKRLANAVAILGTDAELRHAAALSAMPREQALSTWDLLAAAEILLPRQPLEFIHPIARSAIYRELPPGKRSRAHRLAAELLDADGADARQVAVHASVCEPAGDAQVVQWLRAAAALAAAAGAPDGAARFLQRALAEPPQPDLRPQIHFELGRSLLGVEWARAAASFHSAAQAEDPGLRLLALRWEASALGYAGRLGEAVTVFDAALELAGDDEEARLRLIATRDWYACWWADDPDRAGRHRALVRLADSLQPASRSERDVIATAALTIAHTGFDPAARALELVGDVRERVNWDDPAGVETAAALKWIDILCGDPATAALYERSEAAHRSRGWTTNIGAGRLERAIAEFRHGGLFDAEADARAAWEILAPLRSATPLIYWLALAALVEVLLARGALDEVEELATSTGFGLQPLEMAIFPWPPVLRGQISLAHGRFEEGISLLLDAGTWLEERALTNPSRIPWQALVAPALASLGREDEARDVIKPAVRRARRFGAAWGLGMALRAAGTVERGARGIRLLREAVSVLAPSSCRLEHAHALIELGAALRRANQRAEAREHLRTGLELAQRCGAIPLAEHAREELAATGARPRRVMLSGVESLTASERRVAQLAASGMSNPEIAQRLFVTRKTVEAHLGHVYLKLDINSREQLATALSTEAP